MLDLEQREHGVVLPVRAHAGARRNAILGVREGALRVAVTAAPEKGKANQAIIALLSKTLCVSKSAIELVAGETSQHKRLLITGVNIQQTRDALSEIIGASG
jgi:uncharacterized protein (TIGR00251 family)